MKTTRSSGLILHITSLPGPFGIGDLGPEAYRFADRLVACGFKYWQLLPLNPIEKSTGFSPYSSTSAFAGNSMLVSPELLIEAGYLKQDDLALGPKFKANAVAYEPAIKYKKTLLHLAFQRFREDQDVEKNRAFKTFCRQEAGWLDDFALYRVIKELNPENTWAEWPAKIRDREVTALSQVVEENAESLDYFKFTQFLFYQQWQELRRYCNEKGLLLFGDLPFYVSFDSAEVWSYPEYFKLDKNKKPTALSGVPPDYFSKTGQLWGTPVYDWNKLKKHQYDWWIKRLAHNLKLFDVARLDHFRAFYDYWEVPAGEKTAINGQWQPGPADDFFGTLKKNFPEMPFIAEDLGEVGPGVYELRDRWNLPGMAVLQYGFGSDMATSPFIVHNFTENIVAYTGTHDNNTTKGWFRQELKPEDKIRLESYLNHKVTAQTVSLSLLKLALMSVAKLAIFPLQDLLNLDERAIMNKPSVGQGNWKWRVTEAQLDSLKPTEIRELLAIYGRLPKE